MVRDSTGRADSETRLKERPEIWNRWAEVMGRELASDPSRSGPPRVSMATEVRGYRGGVEREGVVSNEGDGVHPHISSTLMQYEGVGHANWTVTYNTMADKERAVCRAYSQGQDTATRDEARVIGCIRQQLDLYFL